jgi:hypothetical protein
MKKKLVTIISLLICVCFSACSTNPGLPDNSVPVREHILITIEDPSDGWFFSELYYGKTDITQFTQTSGKKQILLPAGKQTIRATWPVTTSVQERRFSDRIETTTRYKRIVGSITYDFVPGKKYTIKVEEDLKLKIEEKDGKVKDSHALWIGYPIIYTGWMYPNALATTFGMKEGVEIFVGKSDFKITAEATAGLGWSFKHIMDNVVSESKYDDSMAIFTLPFTAGLKTEYLITPDFGITIGGGITGAYASPINGHEEYINDKGEVEYRNPDPLMPIIPYIQAQLNFRKGRPKGYPSWPFAPLSIYFNYYPKLPSNRASFFGVGLVFVDM